MSSYINVMLQRYDVMIGANPSTKTLERFDCSLAMWLGIAPPPELLHRHRSTSEGLHHWLRGSVIKRTANG
jgi:hypothetical protein